MKFEEIIKLYSKDYLNDLYINKELSKEKIAEVLKISDTTVAKVLNYYNITRDNNKIKSKKSKEINKIKFEKILDKIPKDILYQEYIINNKTHLQIQNLFNIKSDTLDKILNYYNIHKPKNISAKIGWETKCLNAGSKEAYIKNMTAKQKETIIKKEGSLEAHYNKVVNKVLKTKLERYGSTHYYNKDKFKQTCLQKYGVPYTCMRKEARMKGNNSKPNQKFADLLETNNIKYDREFILETKSYDFRLSNNILIEINPSITHNSTLSPFPNIKPTAKDYHKNKTLIAKNNNYRCIHIFDWDDKDKIINLLKPRDTLYARNCEIKEVHIKEAKEYINKYHLQNYVKANIHLGLYFHNKLVSIMTFGKPRYNKNYEYELIRYCSHKNIIGGAEKLFSYFKLIYNPRSIISYCDDSKFTGNIYLKLGFNYLKTSISKHWYNIKTKVHILDSLLRSRGFDQLLGNTYGCYGKGSSNEELMKKFSFVEIYDSGQSVYEYKTEN